MKKTFRKKKILVLSGTPGTGKSTLAKLLEKKIALERLDLHDYYKEISTRYNRQKRCYDIDMNKLEKLVRARIKEIDQKKGGLIIDSHIAHLLPKKIVDLCLILTCTDLKKLEKRLIKRKYSKKKIRENLDAEIFQVCLTEAQEKGHQVITLDTSKDISLSKIGQISQKIKNYL